MDLCDEENKKDEEYHDATENGYTSDAAGGRAAEKSMASANAEMTETKELEGRGRNRFKQMSRRSRSSSASSYAATCSFGPRRLLL